MFRTYFALAIVLAFFSPAVGAGDKTKEAEAKEVLRWRAVLLTSKNYKERTLALKKLEVAGPKTPGVLEDVEKILKRHKDDQLTDANLTEVRVVAAQWIGKNGTDAKKALNTLKYVLVEDPSDEVKEATARALGSMGELAEDALKELAALLQSKNPDLRAAAAETLKELKDKTDPVLTQVLQALQKFRGKTDDPLDRIYMVEIAARNPERALGIVPVLSTVVSDTDDDLRVRKAAAEALGRLGAAARDASPHLEKAFREKTAGVPLRRAALQAFDAVGGTSKDAWPALQGLLQETEPALRLHAVRVVGPVGKEVPAVVKELTTLSLKDTDVEVRLAAIQELGRLGALAREALPTLQRVANDSRPSLRAAAKTAMKLIQTNP